MKLVGAFGKDNLVDLMIEFPTFASSMKELALARLRRYLNKRSNFSEEEVAEIMEGIVRPEGGTAQRQTSRTLNKVAQSPKKGTIFGTQKDDALDVAASNKDSGELEQVVQSKIDNSVGALQDRISAVTEHIDVSTEELYTRLFHDLKELIVDQGKA